MPADKDQRLEVFKTRLSIFSNVVLALIGLMVSYILATNKYHREAEAKRIEYRVEFYKSVGSDLNTLYAFACRVGNYSFTAPRAAGAIKREMDSSFAINMPFMSAKTYDNYRKFVDTFVDTARGEGQHFKFRMNADVYGLAYKNRRKEDLDRGVALADAMQEVSDAELKEWFDDRGVERSSKEVKVAYADLLHGFGDDSGFDSAAINPDKLACF